MRISLSLFFFFLEQKRKEKNKKKKGKIFRVKFENSGIFLYLNDENVFV